MAHKSAQYAEALWEVLRDTETEEERSEIMERFQRVLERGGAEHLAPAIRVRFEELAKRDADSGKERVVTAEEVRGLIAGAQVYKGDYLVDNTLKSRLSRLAHALGD